jgi:hypothetical protein
MNDRYYYTLIGIGRAIEDSSGKEGPVAAEKEQ